MALIIDLVDNNVFTQEEFGTATIRQTLLVNGIPSEENFDWVVQPHPIFVPALFGSSTLHQQIAATGFGISSGEGFSISSVGNITLNSSIYEVRNQFGMPSVNRVSPVPLTSSLIETQLPEFVRADHEHFVDFMEAYYEWLEIYRNVDFDLRRILEYQDVDTTIDAFTEQFFKEFLVNIPRSILADKALVLKHIQDFYRSKGTEKSYRFFFRILFGLEIDFYFPRVDILRVSDGKWTQPKTIRMISTEGNPALLIGQKIRGTINNASAFVENVQVVQEGYLTIYELYLNRSSIQGQFLLEEPIRSADSAITGIVSPVVSSIDIQSGGKGYQVGQEVLLTGSGIGATAKITAVDATGEIISIGVTNFGANYLVPPTVNFPPYAGVIITAQATANIDSIANYPGTFLNEDGQVSTTKYIQDGHFYQQFSYVVFVNESIEKYRDALKKLIHPAGLELFGGLRSQELIDASVKIPLTQVCSTVVRIIQHFKTIWCVFDLDDNLIKVFTDKRQAIEFATEYGYPLDKISTHDSRDVDLDHCDPIDARAKPHSNDIALIHAFSECPETPKLGPTLRSIERDKFYSKPFERRDANIEMQGGPNPNYWGEFSFNLPLRADPIIAYGNLQIKNIGNLTVKEITEMPWKKINIMPEPIVKHSDETGILSHEIIGNHTITNV